MPRKAASASICPKGHYVPVFSRIAAAGDAERISLAPGGPDLLSPAPSPEAVSRLYPSARVRWTAAAAGIAGGVLLGAALLTGFLRPGGEPAISGKPFVQLEMKLAGGPADGEAERVRDALMVALSRFQTLRVMATDQARDVPAVGEASRYRITMKYDGGPSDRSVWWQIVDLASGEALRTDVEKIAAAPLAPSDDIDALVNRLAVRFAGVKGLVNNLETAREVNNPTLGNGCVLRASLAIDAADAAALTQVRTCIERTLALLPSDADANATLSAVLLALDRPDAPTELTQRALEFAEQVRHACPGFGAQCCGQDDGRVPQRWHRSGYLVGSPCHRSQSAQRVGQDKARDHPVRLRPMGRRNVPGDGGQ